MDLQTDSAYWLYETLAMVVESHYADFIQDDLDFQKELSQWSHAKVNEINDYVAAHALKGEELTKFLTDQNHEIVAHCNQRTKEFIAELITRGTELSGLTFKMDPNL